MKLLSKNLLSEYGFSKNKVKTNTSSEVMTRNEVDIIIKDDYSFYFSNNGVYLPIKDIASLRKLYRELKSEELKPVV